MTTIAESLQNAAGAVNDAASQYLGAAGVLNNEIGAVATHSGQDPTGNVGTRLLRAIRGGRLQLGADTSVTPGLIAVAFAIPHTEYRNGMPLTVVLAQDIAGATNLNVDALGLKPIRHPGGGELQRFDYLAGDLVALRYNAARGYFAVETPVSNFVIDAAVTRTVHGPGADFADLNVALTWLGRRRISATGSVTFQLAAGAGANRVTYANNINFAHPDGARVSILGRPLVGALPAGASLSYTGNTPAARATDTATNLTLLRNFFATELYFVGGAGITVQGNLGNIQDVLITSDGSAAFDNLSLRGGFVALTRVASVSAGLRNISTIAGGYVTINGTCYALGAGQNGASADGGACISLAAGSQFVAMGNTAHGVFSGQGAYAPELGSGAPITYARGNGGDGANCDNNGRLILTSTSTCRDNGGNGVQANGSGKVTCAGMAAPSNGGAGFWCINGAFMDASNTTGAGNGTYGYLAFNGANLARTGGTATGATAVSAPAVGSVGNGNAYIS